MVGLRAPAILEDFQTPYRTKYDYHNTESITYVILIASVQLPTNR